MIGQKVAQRGGPTGNHVGSQAARHRLPAVWGAQFKEAAPLAHGVNSPDVGGGAPLPAPKEFLEGAGPADLPVEWPTTFDPVINFKTAQSLGLAIPQVVLSGGTELIQ